MLRFLKIKIKFFGVLTIGVEGLPVGRSFGEDDGGNCGGCACVQEDIGLLVAGVGRPQIRHKLVLHKPNKLGTFYGASLGG